MKKILKWLGIGLLVLVVLPLGIVIAINAVDDKLDPRAAAYGEMPAPLVPDAENGYFGVVAMNAPDGADGMDYARVWIAESRAAGKENRPANRAPVTRAKRPVLCDSGRASCLTVVRDKASEVSAQLQAYREDLERYERLLAFRRYEELFDNSMRSDSWLPSYGEVTYAQRAYLLRAALSMESGNVEEALSALERDIAFQRVMLAGGRTLLGKMIANSLYRRDLSFMMDLLQNRPVEMKPHAARLAAMLQPIDPSALRMDGVYETEFGWAKAAFRDPSSTMWVQLDFDNPSASKGPDYGLIYEAMGTSLFHKKNATVNKGYEIYAAIVSATLKPAGRVSAEWPRAPFAPGDLTFWDYVDNPIGKTLLGIGILSDSYVLRMHDLDAYNRLLGLRLEMLAAGVGSEGAAGFVAKSDARFHDPYTGKPMVWDATSKRLLFKPGESAAGRWPVNLDSGRMYLQM